MVVHEVAGFGVDAAVVRIQFRVRFKMYLKVRLIPGGAQVGEIVKEDGCR